MSTATLPHEHLAREGGLAAGLAAVLDGVDVAAAAPGRWAAVPAGAAGPTTAAPVRHHSMADAEGIVFVECPGARPAPGYELLEIGRGLAHVRLGVVRRLLDAAVEHLGERIVGDEPLLRKQLVTGSVGDTMAEIELLRAYADGLPDPDALADLHARLDALGWQVLMLFGAAGYMADHPARAIYVSALVATTWVDRSGASA